MSTEMLRLRLPTDPGLLAAAGRVALAHGELQHVLRMMIKSISNYTVQKALDETQNTNMSTLRRWIEERFGRQIETDAIKQQMHELLERTREISKRRNEAIHRP